MDFECIMPSKVSPTEKDKYHDFAQMWCLQKQNKQTKTHRHKEQIGSYQKRRGLGVDKMRGGSQTVGRYMVTRLLEVKTL